ncbi:uncharacterized protein SEPMUDRAFT_151723 [Sphaerulina musiva SO2202]|uniref:Uncharacterized protein n=1 Tax=Sphaerulina musiva (strain SO2202) TaxID=692275 RepID=M3CAA7_SPHMS|nr:uncharacterized protein SEPMUDRAFT_151723 [Sphaerulina musiva SO2202]EMF08790.1 hypothetical protein SEPMUDRAFT_151723 [Sphaerulina musiva SO2202]
MLLLTLARKEMEKQRKGEYTLQQLHICIVFLLLACLPGRQSLPVSAEDRSVHRKTAGRELHCDDDLPIGVRRTDIVHYSCLNFRPE